jgi:uncharacterized cupredoxin-like copper-binding protein
MDMKVLAVLVLAVALSVAACGGDASSGAATNGAVTKVTVTLTDNAIALSQPSVASGKVTFDVVNKGTTVHSLVLIRTELPHDKIPSDPKDDAKVDEKGSLLSTGQLAVAESKSFNRDLKAGSYVLVCNEPAHYLVGMHIGFTVR